MNITNLYRIIYDPRRRAVFFVQSPVRCLRGSKWEEMQGKSVSLPVFDISTTLLTSVFTASRQDDVGVCMNYWTCSPIKSRPTSKNDIP